MQMINRQDDKTVLKNAIFFKKSIVLCAFLLVFVALSSCSRFDHDVMGQDMQTVSSEALESMNVEDYFGFFHTEQADALQEEINIYRVGKGVGTLEGDAELDAVARVRVAELIFYFSRTRLDGSDMMTVMPVTDIGEYESAIARGYQTPESIVQAWLNLDHQRDNMENEIFTHIGAAMLEHNNTYYWIVIYAQR